MTTPQNVADAVERLDGYARVLPGLSPCVPTIRAHLMSQEAEIGRLERERTMAGGWASDPVMSARTALTNSLEVSAIWSERALLAESRLAAADALLREALQETLANVGFMTIHNITDGSIESAMAVAKRIQTHLQGAGDEA